MTATSSTPNLKRSKLGGNGETPLSRISGSRLPYGVRLPVESQKEGAPLIQTSAMFLKTWLDLRRTTCWELIFSSRDTTSPRCHENKTLTLIDHWVKPSGLGSDRTVSEPHTRI